MWVDSRGSTVLAAPECRRLLALAAMEARIGRIGIATDQAPVVVPVNFGVREGDICVRVGPGFLARTAAGHLVAFEVDRVSRSEGEAWSVLVRGLAHLIEEPDADDMAALPHPQVHFPGTMFLVIRPDVVTGRRFELLSRP